MFVCPTCGREFEGENVVVKHFLSCWKERNPNHKSKSAPRSEDLNTRIVNDSVLGFFETFKKG